MPFTPTAQFAKNVIVIQCHECEKWRLIYSKTVLSSREKVELNNILLSCIHVVVDFKRLSMMTIQFCTKCSLV